MKPLSSKLIFRMITGRSLGRKLSLAIALTVALTTVLLMCYHFISTSQTNQRYFDEKRKQYIDYLVESLQLPLWNYDTKSVEKLGKMMMTIDSISLLVIRDIKNNLIFSEKKVTLYQGGIKKEILYRNRVVGSFEIGFSNAEFLEKRGQMIRSGMINLLISIVGILISSLFFVTYFLRKPLSEFSRQIESLKKGNYAISSSQDVVVELQDVMADFIEMADKIRRREDALIEANRALQMEMEERKQAEALLQESEMKFRSLANNIPIGLFRNELDGRIIHYNKFLLEMLKIPSEKDIQAYEAGSFYNNPADREKMIEEVMTHQQITGFECQLKRLDGQIVWGSISARVVKDGLGEIQYLDGAVENISEKKAHENQLMQFEKVIEQANEEVVITSPDGTIQYVNPSFERNTGYSLDEVLGKKPSLLKSGHHDVAFYKALWDRILQKEIWQGTIKNKGKNGNLLIHATTITPILDPDNTITAFVSIRRDVTREKEMEMQLFQAQKMQAIGTLAGGIAHDFNNILSGIFGYCQLLQLNIDNSEKAFKYIENINKASQRATELVQQILTFSRQTEYQKKPLDIYLEVNEALKLLRSSIPTQINIIAKLNARSLIVADPTRIHQLVMNLCTNAYHSMRETGGTLSVFLDAMEIAANKTVRNKKMSPGKYLLLSIIDTGHGMDEKTLEKAFEPYYTTKESGCGTGLGLAIVQAIVDEHDGFLDVSSTLGKGTTFDLYFPTVDKKQRSGRLDKKVEKSLNGNETIMLVDDEEAIRESFKDLLERYGYRVETYCDGKEAMAVFKVDPNRFDLIITDMAMPEKTGTELAQGIRSIDQKIPIILCSGFSDLMDENMVKQVGGDKFLLKPVQSIDLLTEIRELL